MVLELDIGILVTVSLAVVGAWWGLARMFIGQFENRQNERFDVLQKQLDGHLSRQDVTMAEIRRVENELSRSQVDAATKYQTKDDAGKQFSQLVQEIRALGNRIDALHGRSVGVQ